MRRNYKCTRGHKHSVFKYSLHVNNREINQEKENETVVLWKLITTETWPGFSRDKLRSMPGLELGTRARDSSSGLVFLNFLFLFLFFQVHISFWATNYGVNNVLLHFNHNGNSPTLKSQHQNWWQISLQVLVTF